MVYGNFYIHENIVKNIYVLCVALQTWCLGWFLPLLVTDKIPLDDENRENYCHTNLPVEVLA